MILYAVLANTSTDRLPFIMFLPSAVVLQQITEKAFM